MDRRTWLKTLTATGIGSLVFQKALAAQAQGENEISVDMIRQAQWVSGVELSDEEIEDLQKNIQREQQGWESLRKVQLTAEEAPMVHFRALADFPELKREKWNTPAPTAKKPDDETELAFSSVQTLSHLLTSGQVTSVQLTQLYLKRLRTYDPLLKCVVNLTEELAMQQAEQADQEIAAGKIRGPLHGIPWGAKDLIAVPGYPTTWGAPQFEDQQLEYSATVYQKLKDAGAVLVAKLSMGALAMGDKWFGGMTRNPWDPNQGSSGSSAGSASAVAAGLVGFAIGTETLGSILSPSRVCGTVGLRPTFGAVSRYGCMPLSWTMDKLGPITRDAHDARLILGAIQGPDLKDPTVVDRNYDDSAYLPIEKLRVGYTKGRRELEDRTDLKLLKSLGCELVEISLPDEFPAYPVTSVLEVEGASVFESWLNAGDTEGWNQWPDIFRTAQFVSAIDYLRAQRLRGRLVNQMEAVFEQVDVLVNANDLIITNLTGHPSLSIPLEFVERNGKSLPRPCVLTGRYFDEPTLCVLGDAMHELAETKTTRPAMELEAEDNEAPPEESAAQKADKQ